MIWQSEQKLKYPKEVLDIVQFGSSVMENSYPNDIDIGVFYQKIPLKTQLDVSQNIKFQLQKTSKLPIHIKSYDYYSFFNESNFAREGILFYGISIISKKYFSNRIGLAPVLEVSYDLALLPKKDKVRFNYLLRVKKGGLLELCRGSLPNPGIVRILPQYEKLFLSEISKFKIKIKIEKKFSLIE